MATITVKVPASGNSKEHAGFIYNVSADIDAGNDVYFVDELDGSEVNLFRLQCASAATINHRAAGKVDHQSQAVYYEAGGWHVLPIGISKILAASTTTSAGIHIAL